MLDECLIKARCDNHLRYWCIGHGSISEGVRQSQGGPDKIRVSRSAVAEILHKLQDLESQGSATKEKWLQEKSIGQKELISKLEAIEAYFMARKPDKACKARSIRKQREDFFRRHALALTPPLLPEALAKIPKYEEALAIPKPPSDRSWIELRPKLLAAREEAERIVSEDKIHLASLVFPRDRQVELYEMTEAKRNDRDEPHCKLILSLTDQALADLGTSVQDGSTALQDVVPLILHHVYESYHLLDSNQKPADHSLLMGDALVAYRQRIVPFLKEVTDPKDLRLYKCPGCKRKDSHQLFPFEEVMRHIKIKHTQHVGSFSCFRVPNANLPANISFPWYCTPWPRNLPILAEHHVSTGHWNPDDDSPYQRAPDTAAPILSSCAFLGRTVDIVNGPPVGHVVENIIYAGELLRNASLDGKFKSQIALRYAADKYYLSGSPPVGEAALKTLQKALVQANIKDLLEGFRCKRCQNDGDRRRGNNKFANRPQSLVNLARHYFGHHDETQWMYEMFGLPSGPELWKALSVPGEEDALRVFDALYPKNP